MPWRASCVETHTACSASGLGKRTDGNIDTAPQADSTTTDYPGWTPLKPQPGFTAWSDDHASVLPLIRWR